MADHDEELAPSHTPGYKSGAVRTIEEFQKLDQGDESLQNWKASLGIFGASALSTPEDPRKVVVLGIALEVAGRPDVSVDLSTPSALEKSRSQPFTIKEGVEYRMKVKFKIQHEVVSGLKYLQVVKRKGIKVDKTEEMIGSYGPSADAYEKKFQTEEAPSGILARGHYEARSKFIDDDGVTHMEWTWSFDLKKDW